MQIKRSAMAGTLESSDIQVMINPSTEGLRIDLESDVKKQFGDSIIATITRVLTAYGIDEASVKAIDKGALDAVVKARTITAAERALMLTEPKWEVL
jgi:citrate lyase subunit gamma (acyl carrier protein)